MAGDFRRGFFSVPIITLAIEAALLAASLMLCTTNSAMESAALPPDLVGFFDAADLAAAGLRPAPADAFEADLAAPDLAAPDFAALDVAGLGLAAELFEPAVEAAFEPADFAADADLERSSVAPKAIFAAPDFAADADFETLAFAAGADFEAAAGLELVADFLVPADAARLLLFFASPAVLAALAAVALPLPFLGAAFVAAVALLGAARVAAPVVAFAGFAEPPSVVAALGPVEVAFGADFFAAIVIPSPFAAQVAGKG